LSRPKLFDRVALKRDFDEHGLKRGDLATLVDIVPHPSGGPEGAVLEVFNALGESIMCVAVPLQDVELLCEDEILTVRRLAPHN
jgi:hypothetical protein